MGRRTRGPGAHHEERRQQISEAVLEIVAERGLPAVSLSEVAAQAGVSPGRVQHYFPTKDRLIEAAFDRGNERSRARIAERVGQDLSQADPRSVLTAVLTELIPHDPVSRTHMRVRQSFTARALINEGIAARLREDYARFHREITELLERDRARGRLPAGIVPEEGAVRLVALAEGLAYYVLVAITPEDEARALILADIEAVYT